MIEVLIEGVANVSGKDERGRTPSHYTEYHGHVDTKKVLEDSENKDDGN